MQIEQVLAKDIDRPLDGVVKASNSAQLQTEVNEYVITAEVAANLGELLDRYTALGKLESNGVWIAGFFGSGKSHLLKMLAYLLGDVDKGGIDRTTVTEAFLDKVPATDALLKGALTRAASIPARSLLFNIDEKVDKHQKNQPDALLKVFVQVFYDACGFFGKTPYIARFERDLTSQGHYEQFREAFARFYGKAWEQGRELAVLVEPHVEKAYAEVTGVSLEKPLTAYSQNYSVSIESFADEVGVWLEQQPPSMRLNFFIDEIGQFIGQNTQLMLSLQTIVESLLTRCEGRAWVMVTSQEVLESIIGDRTKQQQMDFSKIQARFGRPLKLDSKNVREVVSKRLLEKTDDGVTQLGSIYARNADRFRSLFAFHGQRSYQNYATAEDFVGIYPFVDYQFELFHAAMKGLSDYNAFTGRHASVGERSLLGVTKEIGSAMKGADVGALATLDMFYDGIEKSVLSDVKHNIAVATEHLSGPDAPLALRVLKALLMTKYDDQFEATAQSLAVLLTGSIDTNVAALREQIERALQLLVANTYVQRTGTSYSYLTNEEQDVEKAIKAVARNDAAIKKVLNDEVVAASGVGAKVRHAKTGVDLGLERWLDGERQGRTEPLGVHFITPLGGYSLDQVKFQSVGESGTVFVVLDLDQRTLDEIDLFTRTQDYVRLQQSSTLPESRRRILESHQRHNQERRRELTTVLRDAVTEATLLHNGSTMSVGAGNAKDRVQAALQTAIEAKYTRINETRGVSSLKETDLTAVLRDENTFDLEVTSTLDSLVQAVVAGVRQAKIRQVTSSVGSLVDEFAAPPFGWKLTSVLAAIAHGVKTGRVRLQLDSRTLVRTEIAAELRNTGKHRQIIVEEVRDQDPAKAKKVQNFLTGYRDTGGVPASAEELVLRVRTALAEDLTEVKGWVGLGYPFGPDAERAAATLRAAAEGHDDDWYFGDFLTTSDELLDLKDDFLDPVRGFLAPTGSQRAIVDDAREFLQRRGNELANIDAEAADALRSKLDNPTFFRGNTIPQIKQDHLALAERLDSAVTAGRDALHSEVEQQLQQLLTEPVFANAAPAAQEKVRAGYQALLGEVDRTATLGQVALAKLNVDKQYEAAVATLTATGGGPAKTVRLAALSVDGAPTTLTRDDVEPYLDGLRTRLFAAIDDGKTIIR